VSKPYCENTRIFKPKDRNLRLNCKYPKNNFLSNNHQWSTLIFILYFVLNRVYISIKWKIRWKYVQASWVDHHKQRIYHRHIHIIDVTIKISKVESDYYFGFVTFNLFTRDTFKQCVRAHSSYCTNFNRRILITICLFFKRTCKCECQHH